MNCLVYSAIRHRESRCRWRQMTLVMLFLWRCGRECVFFRSSVTPAKNYRNSHTHMKKHTQQINRKITFRCWRLLFILLLNAPINVATVKYITDIRRNWLQPWGKKIGDDDVKWNKTSEHVWRKALAWNKSTIMMLTEFCRPMYHCLHISIKWDRAKEDEKCVYLMPYWCPLIKQHECVCVNAIYYYRQLIQKS